MTLTIEQFWALPGSYANDLDALRAAARMARLPGHVLEFGVYQGRSITALSKVLPGRTIHGFDSFRGLPSDWALRDDLTYRAGHFALPTIPRVPKDVALWPGWFTDTLPRWLTKHAGPVAFVHLDSDLYASAVTVLTLLTDRLVPGSVLVFDELSDWRPEGAHYTRWREGEWRALTEWLQATGRTVRPILRGPRYSAAVEVTS